MAEMIPGVIVPDSPHPDLDDLVEELGTHEPLMSFPSAIDREDDESLTGAFDAMIAAGLIHP